jgi:hypothetical protein
MARGKSRKQTNGGTNSGIEQTLWAAADKLEKAIRNNLAALSLPHQK